MRISDWSSDVCSSDLFALQAGLFYALATWLVARYHEVGYSLLQSNAFFSGFMLIGLPSAFAMPWLAQRLGNRHRIMAACGSSEERRVGEECGSPGSSRWAPSHSKKKKINYRLH